MWVGPEDRGSTLLRNFGTSVVRPGNIALVDEDWEGFAGLFEGTVMLVVWTTEENHDSLVELRTRHLPNCKRVLQLYQLAQ